MKLLVHNTQKQVSLSWQGEIVGESWPGSRRGGGLLLAPLLALSELPLP